MVDILQWRLATCSYRAFRPAMGVPVRTSIGGYRARLAGDVPQEYVKALTPFGVFGVYGDPAAPRWEAAYRDRLERNAEGLAADLDRLTAAHPGRALVLLCFEDVHGATRNVCHRTMAARWLAEVWGLDVPELSPAPDAR